MTAVEDRGFQFEALAGPRQTRLLHLAPGTHLDPLVGRLEGVSLDSEPVYEALSYEWGSSERTREITLQNGQVLYITESLHHALKDIRPVGAQSRIVWADAICINQQNIDELQKQVSMMGSIYRQASQVITYIGPASETSTLGVAFATLLDDYQHSSQDNEPGPQLNSDEMALVAEALTSKSDHRWTALKDLLLRTWASRCWCAQEFLLNDNLIMMCGSVEFPHWHLLPSIVRKVFSRSLPVFATPDPGEDAHSLRECLVALYHLRTFAIYHKRPFTLFELLRDSHPFLASDPRDKVYSVLGLASDRDRIGLQVDYTCTTEELYLKAATRVIECAPEISINVLYSNLHKKTHELPSWVPDWSNWQFGSNGAAYHGTYSACGNHTTARATVRGAELDIAGCIFEQIVHLGEPIGPFFGALDQGVANRGTWLVEQIQLVEALELRTGDAGAVDALWRTLIGNVTLDEEIATSKYDVLFYALLRYREDSPSTMRAEAGEFLDATRRRSRYRRLAFTETGYLGAVPETAEVGDVVCALFGGRLLFVIRPRGNAFTYVGHAYVHGLMNGEVLQMRPEQTGTITLV